MKKFISSPMCTVCEKGLVYVAKIIAYEDDAAIKKLFLCDVHRALLIESVNKVFGEKQGNAEKS